MYEKFGIDVSQHNLNATIMRLISNGNDCESNVSFDENKKATCALPRLVPKLS
jgi:hypothetical protein